MISANVLQALLSARLRSIPPNWRTNTAAKFLSKHNHRSDGYVLYMAISHYCVKLQLWLTATMTQNHDKFIARLPEGLRDRLKKAANRNKRSMNAELVYALELHLFGEEYRVNKQAKEALEFPESSLPVTRGDFDRLLIAFQAELAKKA